MIACKHGREENVKELLASDNQADGDGDGDDDDEEESGAVVAPRVAIDIKNKHTVAAIHYAAKHGHLVSAVGNGVQTLG